MKYISTAELARHLRISAVSVIKRIQKGKIIAAKIGRSYAIPEAYLKDKSSAPIFGPQEEKEFYSVMQAAKLLGMSRISVFLKIKKGLIQAKRIGRHYVIPKEEILKEKNLKEPALAFSEEGYFSVPQLARILGLSRVAVFKKIKKGSLMAKKIGRSYVIRGRDISVNPKMINAQQELTEEFLSVPEAAKLLGISRIAVFKKIKKGQLPARRVGRKYALLKSALDLRK